MVQADHSRENHRQLILGLTVGALALATTIGLWRWTILQEHRHIQDKTAGATRLLHNELMARMEARIDSLFATASRWEQTGRPERNEWEANAVFYLLDHPGYRALEWVDSTYHVKWIIPRSTNESADGVDLSEEPTRRAAMKSAREHRELRITRPLRLLQQVPGSLAFFPLYPHETFDGFIVAVFDHQSLFDSILPDHLAQGFGVTLSFGNELVYTRGGPIPDEARPWIQSEEVVLPGVVWRISVWPTATTISDERTWLPAAILGSGILVSALLALVVYWGLVARRVGHKASLAEKFLKTTIETEPACVKLLAADGTLRLMNRAGLNIIGAESFDQVNGTPIWPIIAPEHLDAFRGMHDAVINGRSRILRFEIVSLDGRRRWLETHACPLRDESGDLNHLAITYDITERLAAEHELLAREQSYRQILDSIEDFILVKDRHSRICYANAALRNYYDMTLEELLGTVDAPFNPLAHTNQYLEADRAVFHKGLPVHIGEEPVMRHDGAVRYFNTVKSPIRDLSGEVSQLVAVCRDITTQRRDTSLLEAERLVLELIATGSPLTEILTSICRSADCLSDYGLCVILTLDGATERLQTAAAPSLPAGFAAGINGRLARPECSPFGIADHTHLPVVIENVADDPRCVTYRDLFLGHGLAAAWSTLILSTKGTVLGTFLVCYRAPHTPTEAELQTVDRARQLAGIAIERNRANEEISRSRDLLEGIRKIQAEFIADTNTKRVFEKILQTLLSVSGSEYGFIGEIRQNAEGEPFLKTYAISNIAWNEETRKLYEDHAEEGLEFHNMKTLFGEAITTGKPVLANDPASDPRRGGKPEGHPPLRSFAGIPLLRGEASIGLVGLANRPGGYSDALVGELQPLLETCCSLVEAFRTNKIRGQIQEALMESETRFRQLAENIYEVFWITTVDKRHMLYVSPGYETIWGRSCKSLYANPSSWLDSVHPDDRKRVWQAALTSQTTGQYAQEYRIIRPDGSIRWIHDRASPVLDEDGNEVIRIVGVAEDITARKQADILLDIERRTLELLARDAAVDISLEFICRTVENQGDDLICTVLILDKDSGRHRTGAAPSLPRELITAIEDGPLNPISGSINNGTPPGRLDVVADIEIDPDWAPLREAVLAHGLKVCWSAPILSALGRVLGTFAVYYRRMRTPTDFERALIARASQLTRLALEDAATRAALKTSEERLRDLSLQLMQVQEIERRQLARDLHDEIGQVLTAVKLNLQNLPFRSPGMKTLLGESAYTDSVVGIDRLLEHVRSLCLDLRPSMLDDLGLVSALRWYVGRQSQRAGWTSSFSAPADLLPLSDEMQITLFRVTQEALTNAMRHSHAKHVSVSLVRENGSLRLIVADDGRGFDPRSRAAGEKRGLGLVGMEERVRSLNGALSIRSAPGRGTCIEADIPIPSSLEGTVTREEPRT